MKTKFTFLCLFFSVLSFNLSSQKVKDVIISMNSEGLSEIIPKKIEVLQIQSGFQFIEGPVWNQEGYLLFSDIPANKIYKYTPGKGVEDFLEPSGHSNGLTYDKIGNLIICEHDGRVTKMDKTGKKTTLIDKFEDKRLNSPNDAVLKSDGSIYFTDPPYGLSKQDESDEKELDFNGIFRLKNGKLTLLDKSLTRPNGIAFSPDEKYLYVANSGEEDKYWMRYDVLSNGELSNGKHFYTLQQAKRGGLMA